MPTDLCPAAAWSCPHRCRWLGCSGRWWCWGSPWSRSSSSRPSQGACEALCGPRWAAAPGRLPAPRARSACCRTHRHMATRLPKYWFSPFYFQQPVQTCSQRHFIPQHLVLLCDKLFKMKLVSEWPNSFQSIELDSWKKIHRNYSHLSFFRK